MTERDNNPGGLPTSAPSVLTTWARSIVAALDARGVDGRALAARAGIDPLACAGPVGRDPVSATGRLWRLAVDATNDPCFGLFASRFLTFPTFQALGVAILASGSVRDAFVRLVRYSRIISDAAEYRLEENGDRCRLVLDIAPTAHLEHEAVDAIVSLEVRTMRSLLGDRRQGPLFVSLRRPRPQPSEAFARFFRAPVEFGASEDVLEFATEVLDAPLPGAQAELALRSEEVMSRVLAEHVEQEVAPRVRFLMRERLPSGEPSQEEIAQALGLGRRTLQRRLANEGTTFAAILADVRTELAKVYLREGRWSITEIAFSLGFVDASSFSRAFRKSTGESPKTFRG